VVGFRVRFLLCIWTQTEATVRKSLDLRGEGFAPDVEPRCAIFRRDFHLPFVPYPGLRVEGPDGWESHAIDSVTWKADEQVFVCLCPDVYPESGWTFDDAVQEALGTGWVRTKKGGGDAPYPVEG